MPFKFTPAAGLPEVIVIEPEAFVDERGWFLESYRRSEFEKRGIPSEFIQDNHSHSTERGILRGLHFQKAPAAQAKLVRCVVGEIFDVAVDIRKGSPTYSKWFSTILSSKNHLMTWIPVGFAHGFLTTTNVTEVEYKVTAEYSNALDRAILWNDPHIGINWPISNPVLSSKDAKAPLLEEADNDFVWTGPTNVA
ncbi:MAG: dTDP-4-dehydrorhamnose 3,5-epimerase [Candidatus Bathyarchaeia archaeon]